MINERPARMRVDGPRRRVKHLFARKTAHISKESAVERSSLQLFRMKNRWGLTILSVVLCFVIAPFSVLGLMMPQVIALLPVLLLLLLGYVGPVSAVVCCGVMTGLCASLYGALGALFAVLALVPVFAAAVFTLERRMPFFPSAGLCAGVLFISFGVMIGVVCALTGSDVVTAITGLLRTVYESMGELFDPMLAMLAQMGVLSMPDGLTLEGIAQGARLSAQARGEMLATLMYILDVGMRMEIPMQMTTGALAAGVLGQAVLRRGLLSRGENVPYPPLRTWRLPNGWGRVLGVTFAALYLLSQLLPERMSVMSYVFSGVFTQIFALQGIAAVCYLLHQHGKRRFFSALAFALGYFPLRSAAVILGIADQAFDFTHRRAALDTQDNPYDPRARM